MLKFTIYAYYVVEIFIKISETFSDGAFYNY